MFLLGNVHNLFIILSKSKPYKNIKYHIVKIKKEYNVHFFLRYNMIF